MVRFFVYLGRGLVRFVIEILNVDRNSLWPLTEVHRQERVPHYYGLSLGYARRGPTCPSLNRAAILPSVFAYLVLFDSATQKAFVYHGPSALFTGGFRTHAGLSVRLQSI